MPFQKENGAKTKLVYINRPVFRCLKCWKTFPFRNETPYPKCCNRYTVLEITTTLEEVRK